MSCRHSNKKRRDKTIEKDMIRNVSPKAIAEKLTFGRASCKEIGALIGDHHV